MSIQALRERLSARAKEVRALVDANPGAKWNVDLQAQYDAGMKEVDEIKNEIDRHQALIDKFTADNLDDSLAVAADRMGHLAAKTGSKIQAIHAKWLRGGDGALNAEEWASIRATMSTTTGSEGGFTVATEVATMIADALKAFGGMRAVGTVIPSVNGNTINFPTSDGTSEEGEQLDQNTAAADADPAFGVVVIPTYKYSSKTMAVPIELLQDSSVDVESFVNKRIVARIGRITEKKFTIGNGTTEPRGIVTAATAGKVGLTGQTLTVIVDDLIDLVHSVDPAYRDSGACRFMMNDASMKIIRKLKDSTGRPIFLPGYDGLGGAMPDTILGYPVQINQNIAVMAASAKSILFGDFSHYLIRDVLGGEMHRFTDSAFAKKGQVGFLAFSRHGGNFTDVGGAVKYYQNSAT